LSGEQRWKINEKLGILDWTGEDISKKVWKGFVTIIKIKPYEKGKIIWKEMFQ
jgi:uncharacterized protein (DUF1015 family)